ncbi:unnamed protein product [Polarella glacialis]|uniref:C3H1-type domain-containing protein n=1 Tax=Polarella glacialis TaxID=89957 RepID=A0A813L7Y3_POLGL|nr:unnamed protein product [Polarella glacialis]
MEFCLEAAVPTDGMIFTEQRILEDADETGKSWGHWRFAAKLVFQPDGVAIGKFLRLCCDLDPTNRGHGHRSTWQASYQVQSDGTLWLYDCKDIAPDKASLSRDLPLTGREVRGCELGQRFIGSGSELERMEAAAEMSRTQYHKTVFHTWAPQIDQAGPDILRVQLKDEHQVILAHWPKDFIFRRVLQVEFSFAESRNNSNNHNNKNSCTCIVTCTGLSGEEVCSFTLPADRTAAELQAEVHRRMGHASLVLSDGRVLKTMADSTPLTQVLSAGETPWEDGLDSTALFQDDGAAASSYQQLQHQQQREQQQQPQQQQEQQQQQRQQQQQVIKRAQVLVKLRAGTCPQGHRLKNKKADGGYECDVCGEDILLEQKRFYDCRKCDFSLCSKCHTAATADSGAEDDDEFEDAMLQEIFADAFCRTVATSTDDAMPFCCYHLQGRCRFGSECAFAHTGATAKRSLCQYGNRCRLLHHVYLSNVATSDRMPV